MRALMVQGTSSWAGKSLIAAALCRHFARRGLRVAPFKAQNMSNNARVVPGGEIGAAQYLQALAARVEPDVRMNPVLVKPEGMTRSQVIVRGVASPTMSQLPWRERSPHLWPAISESLHSLMAEYDLLVLEGAGSPAELNLMDTDVTNRRSAEEADAQVLLVTDIDRGGAFAHLYGTWALVGQDARRRVRGFVLNKFRGDPSLLPPAPEKLEALTGVPVLGVIPMFHHHLPDEDGAAMPPENVAAVATVAIVRYPFASNLDEFKLLEQIVQVRWARRRADLAGADIAVLPGSKNVGSDLEWLRATGLDEAVCARAQSGLRVLGICGGLQMLGRELHDPAGIDASGRGLGLLPLATTFHSQKLVRRAAIRFHDRLPEPWSPLAAKLVRGYEIRHGRTVELADTVAAIDGDLGWIQDAVLGITVHGLFEDAEVLSALFGRAPHHTLDSAIDAMTDVVVANLDMARIDSLVRAPGLVSNVRPE